MRRWDEFTQTYLNEYTTTGVMPERITQVQRELEHFGVWLKRRRPPPAIEDIDADLIVHYLQTRTTFRAKATVSSVMSTLRCWGEWLVREGHWKSNPLKWLRGPKLHPYAKAPKRLKPQQLTALWQQATQSRGLFARHQWLTILALLYGVGLRRGEVHRLNVEHWDRQQGTLLVQVRKTGRERTVALPELAHRCLETYLPHRHNRLILSGMTQEQTALFVTRQGQRLSCGAISHGIHRLARRAQVQFHSLHQFRHTCASDLLEAGARLPEVQQLLGHQSISTTMRYLHFSDLYRHEAVAHHPLNDYLVGASHE